MTRILSISIALLFAATELFAQHKHKANSERASPHDTVSNNDISIAYGRPYKKGRVIFGTQEQHDAGKCLEIYGKVWRTGADEATVITLKKGGMIGDKHIAAGTYSLFTIPGEKEWTIILNNEVDQWGAFTYDKFKDKDAIRVTVPARSTDKPVEQFTITLPKKGILLEWDKTSVLVPVKLTVPLPTY